MHPTQNLDELNLTERQRETLDLLYRFGGCRVTTAQRLGINERNLRKLLAKCVDAGWNADDCPPLIKEKPTLQMVNLDDLILSDQLQPRESLNKTTVQEYAKIYSDQGADGMEPIRAYRDLDDGLLVTRGFTRVAAARIAELAALPCEVYPSALFEDMLIDSLGGNKHGLQLTNADKHRAIKLYHDRFDEVNWMPTREVAKLIGCSHEMVAKYRRPDTEEPAKTEEKTDLSTADSSDETPQSDHDDEPSKPETTVQKNIANTIIEMIRNVDGFWGDPAFETNENDNALLLSFFAKYTPYTPDTILQIASNDPRLMVSMIDGETYIALKETTSPAIEPEKPTQFHKQSASSKADPATARNSYMRQSIGNALKAASHENRDIAWHDLAYLAMRLGLVSNRAVAYKDPDELKFQFTGIVINELQTALSSKIVLTVNLPPFDRICHIFKIDFKHLESRAKTEFPD